MSQPAASHTMSEIDSWAAAVVSEGWCVTPRLIDDELLDGVVAEVGAASGEGRAGVRNPLEISEALRRLARHEAVRAIPQALLGPDCFVARAIYFDKTPQANWKVPWHQDLTIAVERKFEAQGFGPWSIKEGVVHVRPPVSVLQRMVAIRIHLDDCGHDNGPLRIIPRSHRLGMLDPSMIESLRASTQEVACIGPRGSLLAFAPLLLHASSPAARAGHRRIAHLEFAVDPLLQGLEWRLRWR